MSLVFLCFIKKAQVPDVQRTEKIVQIIKRSKYLGTISIYRVEPLNALVEFSSIFMKSLDPPNIEYVSQVYLLFVSFISPNTMQITA